MEDTGERVIPDMIYKSLGHYINFLRHMVAYKFTEKFVWGKNVLDIGCGCGYGTCYLATHCANNVIGVDVSPSDSVLQIKSL